MGTCDKGLGRGLELIQRLEPVQAGLMAPMTLQESVWIEALPSSNTADAVIASGITKPLRRCNTNRSLDR